MVKEGTLWLVSGPASVMSEDIPAGVLTDDALLLPPPAPIPVTDLLPEKLPEAWEDNVTIALALATALSRRAGRTLPWIVVRNAIESAMHTRLLEATADSASWPCDLAGAGKVKLRVPSDATPPPEPKPEGLLVAEAELKPNEIQDLADVVGEITKLAAGNQLKFKLRIELGGETKPPDDLARKINRVLEKVADSLQLK
jgi:hypothetical protein